MRFLLILQCVIACAGAAVMQSASSWAELKQQLESWTGDADLHVSLPPPPGFDNTTISDEIFITGGSTPGSTAKLYLDGGGNTLAQGYDTKGDAARRIFTIYNGVNVTINDLILRPTFEPLAGPTQAARNPPVPAFCDQTPGNGWVGNGGAICVMGATLSLANVKSFGGNVQGCFGSGGSLAACCGSFVTMQSSRIEGAAATDGGGAAFYDSEALINDTMITENSVDGGSFRGGGLFISGSNVTMLGGLLFFNYHGGGAMVISSTVLFDHVYITNNEGGAEDGELGALACTAGSSVTANGCSFKANGQRLGGDSSGAVYVRASEFFSHSSLFAHNVAFQGGALQVASGNATIVNTSFVNNSAFDTGGAMWFGADVHQVSCVGCTCSGNAENANYKPGSGKANDISGNETSRSAWGKLECEH